MAKIDNQRIIDLSHTIHAEMNMFPGTEKPVLQKLLSVEKDGFAETKLSFFSHTGTHMDAPAHMLKEGWTLDRFPIDHFTGKALLVDVSEITTKFIPVLFFDKYIKQLETVDFLILRTGWSKFWESHVYFDSFPALSAEATGMIATFNLKGVGIDVISIDLIDSIDFVNHHILLKKNILIIENLTNLEQIDSKIFSFTCLPLKFIDADGAPARAMAIV
jgi:kynurenine formamidase